MRLPTVAIVGRPNVGKSTLFNRILGRRVAIVSEQPGVTRDRQFGEATWNGRGFFLVDTGGIIKAPDRRMDREIGRQVEAALQSADAIILVVDGKQGVHPVDRHVAAMLRKSGRPVLLAVNKLDELGGDLGHLEFFELGLGDPVGVSALSGKGSGDLLDRLLALVPPRQRDEASSEVELSLAVIGRPNVGKSSFVNRLLGQERLIVHEQAGTTRDAVDTYLEFEGARFRLIDTAGLRRRSRVGDEVEFYSRVRTTAAIRRADVCALLVDAHAGVANQDFRIGQDAWDSGAGLILVVNKWDLIEDRGPTVLAEFVRDLRERASYLRWVPIVTVSARTGLRLPKVLELARVVQRRRGRRVPTAEVNRVLLKLLSRVQPPQGKGGNVRLYYGSQVAASPPLFVLWCNRPKELASHYLRYLEAGFRSAWDLDGTPIRLKVKRRREHRSRP
ncbi:MAG: ribosome biogenesis GTPase Der [Gemmatimonadota bacterium]